MCYNYLDKLQFVDQAEKVYIFTFLPQFCSVLSFFRKQNQVERLGFFVWWEWVQLRSTVRQVRVKEGKLVQPDLLPELMQGAPNGCESVVLVPLPEKSTSLEVLFSVKSVLRRNKSLCDEICLADDIAYGGYKEADLISPKPKGFDFSQNMFWISSCIARFH